MKETQVQEGAPANARCVLSFLIPTYRTPLLTGELLYAALACGNFSGCQFVLLLDASDPHLLAYKALVESVREKGLSVGFFVFDGTPYCGMINRVAPIVTSDCLCVLDSRHMPLVENGVPVAEAVSRWIATSPQTMRVGIFSDNVCYPVVTRKLVERLGYMFHPLCYGRPEAENWLLNIGSSLGILSSIPNAKIVESPADGVEIIGVSEHEDAVWVDETLGEILGDETERLEHYLLS